MWRFIRYPNRSQTNEIKATIIKIVVLLMGNTVQHKLWSINIYLANHKYLPPTPSFRAFFMFSVSMYNAMVVWWWWIFGQINFILHQSNVTEVGIAKSTELFTRIFTIFSWETNSRNDFSDSLLQSWYLPETQS